MGSRNRACKPRTLFGFRLFAYGIDNALYSNALRHGLDLLRQPKEGRAS